MVLRKGSQDDSGPPKMLYEDPSKSVFLAMHALHAPMLKSVVNEMTFRKCRTGRTGRSDGGFWVGRATCIGPCASHTEGDMIH